MNLESYLNTSFALKTLGQVSEIKSSKRIFVKDYQKSGIPFYRSKEIVELAKNYKQQQIINN